MWVKGRTMPGSSIGEYFRIVTFGESHGRAIGVVLDGVKPGVPIDLGEVQHELDRRRPGQSSVTTPRAEEDRAEILSGVFEGKTTGSPICMVIWNKDQRPEAYAKIKNMFRPGHAGYTYLAKFGVSDYRGGGRASGRETAARVAAGAVAKQVLKDHKVNIIGYTREVAGIVAQRVEVDQIEKNPLRCPDPDAARAMEAAVLKARDEGDSVGGIVEIIVKDPPPGLGEPVFDKLEADLAKALMSIGAVKGFEIGNGFRAARLRGSENNDPMYIEPGSSRVRTRTNNAGGIAGGISNGEDIVIRIAVKPTSSIKKEQETVTIDGQSAKITVEGRHDPCICPRIVPVAEAMVALTLLDHLLRQRTLRRQPKLRTLRDGIDLIDHQFMLLIAQRQELALEVGKVKARRHDRIVDLKREKEVLDRYLNAARALGLDLRQVRRMFGAIITMARATQYESRKKRK
jgi:chorismate synthase